MTEPPTPRTAREILREREYVRCVGTWFLSLVLVIGLVLGQSAQAAGPADDYQTEILGVIADIAGQQTAPVPACDPGVTCFGFVLLAGQSAVRSLVGASVMRPALTRPQRRIGGPSVTLPPPRTLT